VVGCVVMRLCACVCVVELCCSVVSGMWWTCAVIRLCVCGGVVVRSACVVELCVCACLRTWSCAVGCACVVELCGCVCVVELCGRAHEVVEWSNCACCVWWRLLLSAGGEGVC